MAYENFDSLTNTVKYDKWQIRLASSQSDLHKGSKEAAIRQSLMAASLETLVP